MTKTKEKKKWHCTMCHANGVKHKPFFIAHHKANASRTEKSRRAHAKMLAYYARDCDKRDYEIEASFFVKCAGIACLICE